MAKIIRFNAAYNLAEDRIQLQIVGEDWNQNFWITRRSLVLLGNVLHKLLGEHYQHQAQLRSGNLALTNDFAEFGHAASLAQNPISPTKQLEETIDPPIVLFKISFRCIQPGLYALEFKDIHDRGHGYQLAESMLHVLLELLQTQADKANWDIQISTPPQSENNDTLDKTSRLLN